jgi:hypothetical protein
MNLIVCFLAIRPIEDVLEATLDHKQRWLRASLPPPDFYHTFIPAGQKPPIKYRDK